MNPIRSGAGPEKQKLYYGWFIVISGFFLLMCSAGSGFYSFGVFIKPLEDEFGWSRSQIALTISIFLMVNGLAAPIAGRLVQTMGPKKVICISALGSSLTFFLIGFSRNLYMFYSLYALLALNMVGISYIPVSTLVTQWFDRRRGTAMGLVYMGISAGGMIFAPLIGQVNLLFGWRYAYLFLSLFVLAVAVPIGFFVIKEQGPWDSQTRSDRQNATVTNDPEDAEAGKPLGQILATRAFRWISLTFFLGAMAMMAMLQHQVAMMSEKAISYMAASTALGITSGMGAVGKLCFGRMTESFPLKWIVTACYAFQAAGVLLLMSLSRPYLIWIYALVFGFGMGGVLVLQPLAVGQYFGLKSFSVVLGGITFCQSLGASLGAFSAGLMYDYLGNYQLAMLLFLILYAASVFSIFMAGEPRTGEKE